MKIVRKGGLIFYWCQGCKTSHAINTDAANGRPCWTFDGNETAPTFGPSIRTFTTDANGQQRTLCHHFVKNGSIDFLADSTQHALRGVHPLEDVPEWVKN